MRILFISNYYPPCQYSWGYQQLCEEVADGLAARGHAVEVLTSTYHDGGATIHSYPVRRLLTIDPDWHCGKSATRQFFVGRLQRERRDVAHLRQVVQGFGPNVILIWHTLGVSKALLQAAEQLPGVVVAYYLADYTPEVPDEYVAYWQGEPTRSSAKLLKRPLARLALLMLARERKPLALKYKNVICVSAYVRQRLVSEGLISDDAVVIHNGVDLEMFAPDGRQIPAFSSAGLRCLVAGRIVPDKGVHTVIESLARLRASMPPSAIRMTVLGDGPPDYFEHLYTLVVDNRLQEVVEFHPPVPREQMPLILGRCNTLILSSEYAEPLARAMQEAMAMRLLVIGTTTGGSGELLVHEKTGLVFEPGNPESLVSQLSRALHEPDLAARLAAAGRREVRANFDIRHTVRKIESYLRGVMYSGGAQQR